VLPTIESAPNRPLAIDAAECPESEHAEGCFAFLGCLPLEADAKADMWNAERIVAQI
jgi:hypothetical protein